MKVRPLLIACLLMIRNLYMKQWLIHRDFLVKYFMMYIFYKQQLVFQRIISDQAKMTIVNAEKSAVAMQLMHCTEKKNEHIFYLQIKH